MQIGSDCGTGTFIADPNIGESPGFCSIPREDSVLDWCGNPARFVDEGEEYRETGCALSLEIEGEIYSRYETLDAGSFEDNPCSSFCGDGSQAGLLLFKGLPPC